jgi:dTDP-4-amino-4,6-dideoxygalactose transaminase
LFDEKYFEVGTNEKVRQELEKINIETRPLWKPLHQQPIYEKQKAFCNGVSDKLFATGLCLPSGSNISDENRMNVIDALKRCL